MQISSNYSMNGVPYENRRRQNDIPQFSTERAEQENESINPYMEDTDFNEKAFDVIGPNAPQDVKDAWMEAAKEVNANGMGIKKNGMLSHISQMMVQRLNKQLNGEGDVDNIDILGNTTESAIQATSQALYDLDHPREYVPKSIEGKTEVSKVAPNRAALIGKFSQSMNSGNMSAMKEVEEADKKWLCMLFGIPYEAKYQGTGTGSAIHVYNEDGEEVLTYTGGVGWQEKETKAESQVHSALKMTYYEAFSEARKALNSEEKAGSINKDIISQGNFDMKA